MFYTYIEEYSTETMLNGHEAEVVNIRECNKHDSLDDAVEDFMSMVENADRLGYEKTFYRGEPRVHYTEEIFSTHTLIKNTNMYHMASYGNKCCLVDLFSIKVSEEKPHDMVYHLYEDQSRLAHGRFRVATQQNSQNSIRKISDASIGGKTQMEGN